MSALKRYLDSASRQFRERASAEGLSDVDIALFLRDCDRVIEEQNMLREAIMWGWAASSSEFVSKNALKHVLSRLYDFFCPDTGLPPTRRSWKLTGINMYFSQGVWKGKVFVRVGTAQMYYWVQADSPLDWICKAGMAWGMKKTHLRAVRNRAVKGGRKRGRSSTLDSP